MLMPPGKGGGINDVPTGTDLDYRYLLVVYRSTFTPAMNAMKINSCSDRNSVK